MKRVTTHSFVRNVALVGGGTMASRLVLVAIAPILTRLFLPEHFGALGVFATLFGLLIVAAGLGFNQAVPLPRRPFEAFNLVVLSVASSVIVALAFTAVIAIWGSAALRLLNVQNLGALIWLVPLAVPLGTGNATLRSWCIRTRDFGLLARARFLQSTFAAAIQILLGIASPGAWGLILGHIASTSGGTALLARPSLGAFRRYGRHVRLRTLARAASIHRRFPLMTAPGSLLNSAGLHVPILLLAAGYGSEALGQFVLVQRVLAGPASVLGESLRTVFIGDAAERIRTADTGLSRQSARIMAVMSLLVGLPTMILALSAVPVFRTLFGTDWIVAGEFARWMSLPLFMQLAIEPVTNLTIINRQDLALAWSAARLIFVALALAIPISTGAQAQEAVAAYAVSMASLYLVKALLWFLALRTSRGTHT